MNDSNLVAQQHIAIFLLSLSNGEPECMPFGYLCFTLGQFLYPKNKDNCVEKQM